ncbi:pentapeptide repeat-containing protein [Phormidium tenue FACHB-886]|nr:pentapeptide repeat-containing protein [Phormidium tenue FACHB-886]
MTLNQPINLAANGYQIVRELGRNWEGGRITYLANTLDCSDGEAASQCRQVVIKEFRFAAIESGWSGYKAHEREIEVLQQLEHPQIPDYLDSFETPSGFCLVQQYHDAPSLAERSSFTPEAVKQIALSVLGILVYLQTRTPPIIHRDIKPENILVDKQLNAYLIDFGFARIRDGELALSSVAAGTPGFIPPEEQFGRPLTEAFDLYSLGSTLICLLTGTRSNEVHKLLDDHYRFNLRKLLPQLSRRFVEWLSKLVEPSAKYRYTNAAAALEALFPIEVGQNWAKCTGMTLLKVAIGLSLISNGSVWVSSRFSNPATSPEIADHYTKIPIRSELQADLIKRLIETRMCRGCDLRRAQLANANLQGVDLAYATLEEANLAAVNLQGANLFGANLKGADLHGANLKNARLVQVNLASANLRDANLENVYSHYSNLSHAILSNAILKDSKWDDINFKFAELNEVNAVGANLQKSNFTESKFIRANLERANLADNKMVSVDLTAANLEYAQMSSVNLTSSNLTNANLTGANLRYATLREAKLEGANLTNAELAGTTMPNNRIHP